MRIKVTKDKFKIDDKVKGYYFTYPPGETYQQVNSYTGTIIFIQDDNVFVIETFEGEEVLVETLDGETIELIEEKQQKH